MLQKLKKFSRPELFVFSLILLLVLLKALLITPFTSDSIDFLGSYHFLFSDSYDWLANGFRLFQNDAISYRNPGYVLLIKALHSINALFLLPLIGNLTFFVLIVYVYKICLKVSKQTISLALAMAIALNYSFNLGADSLLADIYAVATIAASFYYVISKKYLTSAFLLGLSILFQNFGFFLIPIWATIYISDNIKDLRSRIHQRDLYFFINGLSRIAFAFLPLIAWSIYRLIKFGNPMFSKIPHLSLIHADFNSIDFYLINSISMFGIVIIPLIVFSILNFKKIYKNRTLKWSVAGLALNFIFWVIVYSWDDRRFLIYFIPFLYPIVAYFMQTLGKGGRRYVFIMLAFIYPTILPIQTFLSSTEQPVVHNNFIEVVQTDNKQWTLTFKRRQGFENILMNLDPILFNSFLNFRKNHTPNSTNYTYYTEYIDNNYDQATNTMCLDEKAGIKQYVLRSVLMINRNIDLSKVKLLSGCNAKF